MGTQLKKYLQLFSTCLLILWGGMQFRVHTCGAFPETADTGILSEKLYGIQPVKDCAALATATFSAAAPQVISLRTQQFQQQTQGKSQVLHGLHPKHTARPRQADKVTTTFCRRNIYPVDYFIYFLQEIII